MSCATEVWRSVVKGSVFSVHMDPSTQRDFWLLHVNMFFAVHVLDTDYIPRKCGSVQVAGLFYTF